MKSCKKSLFDLFNRTNLEVPKGIRGKLWLVKLCPTQTLQIYRYFKHGRSQDFFGGEHFFKKYSKKFKKFQKIFEKFFKKFSKKFQKFRKFLKFFLRKLLKMHYFSIFSKEFNKPCVNVLRVWTKKPIYWKF